MELQHGNGRMGADLKTVLIGVPSDMARTVWPKVKGLVKKGLALHEGRCTPETILANVSVAKQQLWIVAARESQSLVEAVAVTEIINGVGTIVLTAGAQRERWVDHVAEFEAWAVENGCHAVEYLGRPGWEREPKLKSYRRIAVLMRKELKRERIAA